MSWQLSSVLPVWVLSLAGAIVIAVVLPRDQYLTWVAVVLAGAVILTFLIQLALRRKEGFVVRAMASMGVSAVIGGGRRIAERRGQTEKGNTTGEEGQGGSGGRTRPSGEDLLDDAGGVHAGELFLQAVVVDE